MMLDKKIPESRGPRDERDETPSTGEWLRCVQAELENLSVSLDQLDLPKTETPPVRNALEGLSVTLGPAHRQIEDLKVLLEELEA